MNALGALLCGMALGSIVFVVFDSAVGGDWRVMAAVGIIAALLAIAVGKKEANRD